MKVAITGGIGSGKSFVCRIVESMGYPVYYCDDAAKRLMIESRVIRTRLTELLGDGAYEDGVLNKPLLASFLFSSADNAAVINSIVHPVVKEDFLSWASSQTSDLVFMESAILYESGFDALVDAAILVWADISTRIERAMKRDSATEQQIRSRIAQQVDSDSLRDVVDYVVDNSAAGSPVAQITEIINNIKQNNKEKLC